MSDTGASASPPQTKTETQKKGPIAALAGLLTAIEAALTFASNNKPTQRFIYTTLGLDPIQIGIASAPDNIGNVGDLLRRYDELRSDLRVARAEAERGGSARHQQELEGLRRERSALLEQNEARAQEAASRERDLQASRATVAGLEARLASQEARLRQQQSTGSSPRDQRAATSSPIGYAVDAVTVAGNVQNSYFYAQLSVRFEIKNHGQEPLKWAVWGSNRAMASTDGGLSFNSVQNQNSTVPYCYVGSGAAELCRTYLRALPSGASSHPIAFRAVLPVANACDARKAGSKADLSIPIVVSSGGALEDFVITGRVDMESRITAQGC